MKATRQMLALLLAALFALTDAYATPQLRIYIRNQAYAGPSYSEAKTVWLPVERYAKEMHLQLTQGNGCCQLNDSEHPAGAVAAATVPASTLYVNGQPLANVLTLRSGVLYLAARPVTLALGGSYRLDVALGMVDIHGKRKLPRSAPTANAQGKTVAVAAVADDVTFLHFYAPW
jgi:hypothetical protein